MLLDFVNLGDSSEGLSRLVLAVLMFGVALVFGSLAIALRLNCR